jgi:hypothetical protein
MSSTLLDRVAKDARMNDVIVHKEVVLFTPGFPARFEHRAAARLTVAQRRSHSLELDLTSLDPLRLR